MTIIKRPDSFSLLGNLKHLVISASDNEEVTMTVLIHGEQNALVTHVYSPSNDGSIDIDLKDIVGAQLSFLLRDTTDFYQQPDIARTFDVNLIGSSSVDSFTFTVVRAGVDRLADSVENFLTQNFLTWQPNMKPVTYYTPEFLTYYATMQCRVRCKAYHSSGESVVTLALLSSGICYTIPVGYQIISGKINTLPSYYDVWVEDFSGNRLTYIQRYYASDIKSEEEQWILFENSLGGIDTFRAYGDKEVNAEHSHQVATIDEVNSEYRVDLKRKFKKSTGFLDERERRWLLDFFPSLGKYICEASYIRRIVVTDDDVSYSAKDLPSEYTFTYQYADEVPYLNLPRVDTRLQEMNIEIPDVGSFTIAPRLAEFPRLQLSGGALFPVQNPYSEEWGATTLTTLAQYLSDEILYLAELFGESHFISRLHDDVANGRITFRQGLTTLSILTFGSYVRGLRGGMITEEAIGELEELWIRATATIGDGTRRYDNDGREIPALAVKGDATFTDNLSSPEYISGFLGGNGWAIKKTEFVNAAGVVEYKYTIEIDNATIRNTLRVYEMIVSQLMGENANRFFSDMMEVDHYDPETGKVWLLTGDGKLYNSLRVGDIIEVQQYNGEPTLENDWYVTKAYEFRVKAAGVGDLSLGEDRLDWIEFENFASQMENMTPERAFKKHDTLVRADSDTNPNRKGLVTVMAVGENTPYIDILYGLKTDPPHAMKGRLGNLQGIRTDDFGWLKGYGIYTNNFYGTGELHDCQTGERYTARINATKQQLTSMYKETTWDISEEDNIIANGFFVNGMEKWTVRTLNGSTPMEQGMSGILASENVPILMNGQLITLKNVEQAAVIEYDSMPMLKLNAMGIAQSFADMGEITKHKELTSSSGSTTHDVNDTLYMGVRILPLTSGELRVSFIKNGGSTTGWSRMINSSLEWMLVQEQDSTLSPWDFSGSGQFVISYSGECLIRFVALTTDPIADMQVDYMTRITQTARVIKAEADAVYATRTMHSELSIQVGRIATEVTNNKDASDRALATLSGRIGSVETWENNTATWITQTDSTINLWASQFDDNGDIIRFSAVELSIDNLRTTVTNNYNASESAFAALRSRATALENFENSTATWIYQTQSQLNLWATSFNNDGSIKDLSQLRVDVNGLYGTVGTLASTAAMESYVNTLTSRINSNDTDINTLNTGLRNEQIARASAISALRDQITAVVACFDEDGDVISGSVWQLLEDKIDLWVEKSGLESVGIHLDGNNSYIKMVANNFSLWSSGSPSEKLFGVDSQGHIFVKDGTVSGNTTIKYENSSVDGLRITSTGVERWLQSQSKWVPLYAARYARDYSYVSDHSSKTVNADDDFIVLKGNYQKIIVLPSNPFDGKTLTLLNLEGTSWVRPNSGHTLRVGSTTYSSSSGGKDLNNFDRAELTFVGNVWYWNYMSV